MSGQKGPGSSDVSGNERDAVPSSAGEAEVSAPQPAGSIWLNIVGALSQTEDDDYTPRPYPVLAGVIQEEAKPASPERPLPVKPFAVSRAPAEAPASPSPAPVTNSVAARPPAAAPVVKRVATRPEMSATVPSGPIKVRSRVRRGKPRGNQSYLKLISLVLTLAILGGGGWLFFKDVYQRPKPPEGFSEWAEPVPVVAARVHEVATSPKPVVVEAPAPSNPIEALALASVDNNWDMSASAWSSTSASGAASTSQTSVVGTTGATEAVVTPVIDGTGRAPSSAFLSYAATLKITVVVRGERLRATINGTGYTEGDVLDAGLGIRLVGRDAQVRALVFEDATRARVKVSY